MRKLLFSIALGCFAFTTAQTFGVKAGANFSLVNGSTGLNQKGKVGFHAGVFMNTPLAADFSIQPEVLYNNLGAKIPDPYKATINLDYIAVPIMFQYNATPQLYLEAGPEFSFLLDSKVKADDPIVQAAGNALFKKERLNSFNFGLGLGAGYYFTPNIGLTARYVAGLTDIAKDRDSNDSNRARNNVFQLGLAYKFSK